jgi:hypothetical protein
MLNNNTIGALVAQWLVLLTSDLEEPGSNPMGFACMDVFHVKFVHYVLKKRQLAARALLICPRFFLNTSIQYRHWAEKYLYW